MDREGTVHAWAKREVGVARVRGPASMSRSALEALVEGSAEVLGREEHRRIHSKASDFRRWGATADLPP